MYALILIFVILKFNRAYLKFTVYGRKQASKQGRTYVCIHTHLRNAVPLVGCVSYRPSSLYMCTRACVYLSSVVGGVTPQGFVFVQKCIDAIEARGEFHFTSRLSHTYFSLTLLLLHLSCSLPPSPLPSLTLYSSSTNSPPFFLPIPCCSLYLYPLPFLSFLY